MTKKLRPSINDQLARIASAAPVSAVTSARDNATTSQRGNVVPENESRSDVSRDHVEMPEPTGPDGYKRRVRFEKPHASVYAHPKVFKALREIAAATDCKPHDLYIEGLRLVLRQHGQDFDALNRGE